MRTALLTLVAAAALVVTTNSASAQPPRYYHHHYYNNNYYGGGYTNTAPYYQSYLAPGNYSPRFSYQNGGYSSELGYYSPSSGAGTIRATPMSARNALGASGLYPAPMSWRASGWNGQR